MADKGAWPKSYRWPSALLSLACLVLLVWHFIDPARQIDAWTVTLLVVGFLPWLRYVFESIAFPGGGSIKFRDLEAKQAQQQEQIDALRFVVAYFLPDEELRVLKRFVAPEPYPMDSPEAPEFYRAKANLHGLGFIEPIADNWNEEFGKGPTDDLKIFFRISDRGREFLRLREKTGPLDK
ncbi:hypothetical protein XA26_06130 [Mycolicibacterium fortuitum]|uniref:Uncharacterized protein n=1 Tax=Mycolicibacterium fortuitum TaxID=1766 RepID=A0A0N9XWD7_MYCFO|nr:hypothetical protein [Mycolicibacterium fortuitum]ALI24474.1 hypothetical protein XA26_06130 [Mycolicibacterium fortuitum]